MYNSLDNICSVPGGGGGDEVQWHTLTSTKPGWPGWRTDGGALRQVSPGAQKPGEAPPPYESDVPLVIRLCTCVSATSDPEEGARVMIQTSSYSLIRSFNVTDSHMHSVNSIMFQPPPQTRSFGGGCFNRVPVARRPGTAPGLFPSTHTVLL